MNTIYLFYRRYFAILVLLTCCTGAFSQSVLHSDADKRLKSVNDSTTLAAHKDGFRLKDGANESVEYSYDANGNLTRDLNKNITEIQYNVLNLPSRVTFADGNRIEYMYDASGTKLRTVHYINGVARTTDYCGNAIYENGELKMLLNEVGYYSFQDKKYHYYLKDHQGNVRVVADEDGNVEETNDYYPFGGLMASSSGSVQPYKYNGKELDGSNGLDWYDYGARHYDPALGRWHTMDPMCEKYYSVSPYTYCVNNPMKYIDPNGEDILVWYKDNKDKWQTWSFNGSNHKEAPKDGFISKFLTAYDYDIKNGGGDNLKKAATSTDFSINLARTTENSERKNMNTGKPQLESFVLWNPELGVETKEGYSMSPATILEHEMDHGVRYTTIEDYSVLRKETKDNSDPQYGKLEERRVITGSEAKTARANGEVPKNYSRKSHAGRHIVVPSPISNKKIKYRY